MKIHPQKVGPGSDWVSTKASVYLSLGKRFREEIKGCRRNCSFQQQHRLAGEELNEGERGKPGGNSGREMPSTIVASEGKTGPLGAAPRASGQASGPFSAFPKSPWTQTPKRSFQSC